jgi:hypothetical protein
MELFGVNIYLRIITTSDEEGQLLILLDDSGNIPKISLTKNCNIEETLLKKLSELVYENEMYIITSTKQISSINVNKDTVEIYYNFITSSTTSKSGVFSHFDKKSIELHRLIHNHTL